jgi:hypothetical protein
MEGREGVSQERDVGKRGGVASEGIEGGKGSSQRKASRKETGLLKAKVGRGFRLIVVYQGGRGAGKEGGLRYSRL